MALWKYDIVVMTCAEGKERENRIWEAGRAGWELVQVLQGDWIKGDTETTEKMTWFLKREATHDIGM